MWSIGFLFGVLTAIIFVGIGVCFGRIDKRDNKGELDGDSDIRLYVPSRCGDRRGDNGRDKSLEIDNETLAAYLRTMSVISVSHREAEFLKEAADRLEKGNNNDKDSKRSQDH